LCWEKDESIICFFQKQILGSGDFCWREVLSLLLEKSTEMIGHSSKFDFRKGSGRRKEAYFVVPAKKTIHWLWYF
jgi:hypothetical protein